VTSPDVRVATWRAAGRARTRLSASDRDDGIALELGASARAFETPFGYAISRVPTRGTIRLDGSTVAVRGTSLVEHAYGFRLPADASGWDSFALQLFDGRDFYVLSMRGRDGRPSRTFTVAIDRRGVARRRPAGDLTVGVHLDTHWRSRQTHARYPSLWSFNALREGLHAIELAPIAYDQELVSGRGRASYWDGAIDAYDDNPGGGHIGIGFVQLTGYAGTIAP
jgi:predicted secreted hydrolase